MSALLPVHPRFPRGRTGARNRQLLVVQRATALIGELGAELDRKLAVEPRPAERLRLLRETTNRITRAANDAIEAYRIAQRGLTTNPEGSDWGDSGALATPAQFRAARLELLSALEVASRRYPPARAPAPVHAPARRKRR